MGLVCNPDSLCGLGPGHQYPYALCLTLNLGLSPGFGQAGADPGL